MSRFTVPAGACDTHVHIFPADAVARAGLSVPPAEVDAYRRMRDALGLERAVLVQPSAFAFDNGGLLGAMAALGPGTRGIAMVEPGVDEAELRRLDAAGVRGARLHLLKNPRQSWDDVMPLAMRIAPLGWHIQIQCDGRQLPERAGLLGQLPVPLVLDQTAKFVEPVGTDDPAFRTLLDLLAGGRTTVKLSAPYETSRTGPPAYEDVSVLARALVRAAPDHVVWASNWPHTVFAPDAKPDDAALIDLLADWAPDPAVRRRILVDTPARLYGF